MSATSFDSTFWQAFPGLVWSNAQASDSQRIRAALLSPTFQRLLAIAVRFGCTRLEQEWQRVLSDANDPEVSAAAPAVERILRNIRHGHALASARH